MVAPQSDQSLDQPLHMTDKRVVDQLAHFGPQIHLTLTSILQGGALAYLLANLQGQLPRLTPSDPSSLLPAVLRALATHDFYLTYVVSFLLIVIIWNEFARASFFLLWPLTALPTAQQLLVATFEIAAFSSANVLGPWMFWIGMVAGLGSLIRTRNSRITSRTLWKFKPSQVIEDRSFGSVGQWYLRALSVAFWLVGIALWLFPDRFAVPLALETPPGTVTFHMVYIALVLGVLLVMLRIVRIDDVYFTRYTEEILANYHSMYQMLPTGMIQERPTPAADNTMHTLQPASEVQVPSAQGREATD